MEQSSQKKVVDHESKKFLLKYTLYIFKTASNYIQYKLTKIENGEMDVDQLASRVEEAAKLIKACKEKLFLLIHLIA